MVFVPQYTSDSSIFRRAEEKHIQGITDLGVSLFGTSTTPTYENRLVCWQKNPDAYYVLEQDELIVGWIALVPLKKDAIDILMGHAQEAVSMFVGMHQNVVIPENILSFTSGTTCNIFLTLGARQSLPKSTSYGMRLLLGGYEVLKELARKGILVERLYATSRTPDGVKLCKNLGFQEEVTNNTSAVKRFWLDMEHATSPFLQEYQALARNYTGNEKNEP